ncbi:MAG: hypothetical protein DWQ01_10050 [Planctomycetota bacterium]|nr:MAG: hypothetical protein DWQ01_10050 [Planctomycetota bacterium]
MTWLPLILVLPTLFSSRLTLAQDPTLVSVQDLPTELPIVDPNSENADHVIVAYNDIGDALVVWDEITHAGSQSWKTVQSSAVFIPTKMDGNRRFWKIPPMAHLIGDPEKGVAGKLMECEKPHVTSVGTNFIIAYPRTQTYGDRLTRIETIAVEILNRGDASFNEATFHFASNPGLGHVVSTQEGFPGHWFDAGASGINLGLCQFSPGLLPDQNGVAITFLNQPGPAYEYNLYGIYVNYDTDITGAPLVTDGEAPSPNEWMISGIRSHHNPTYNLSKRIAPRLIEDKNGFLVLAYGEWEDSPTNAGRIVIWSFSYHPNGHLEEEDMEILTTATSHPNWHHRRPVFGKTKDSSHNMSIAWSTFDDDQTDGLDDPMIDWVEFHLTSTGQIQFDRNYPLGNLENVDHARPIFAKNGPLPDSTFEAVLFHDEASSPEHIRCWDEFKCFPIDNAKGISDHADRPAYSIWEADPEYYMAVVFDRKVANQSRPFIRFMDIASQNP